MKRLVSLFPPAPVALGLLCGLLLAFGGLSACGDDCNSATDCSAGEVCLLGICTPSEAQYRACGSDAECNEGAQTELFECVAGRCLVQNVSAPPPPPVVMDGGMGRDAGPSDSGPSDSGPSDGGPSDGGSSDAGS